MLGGGRSAANRRRRSPVAEEGNGDVGGDAGLPEGRGSVGRKEGVEAEPLSASARLGVAGGHEGARRRRRACSVRWETAREGAGEEWERLGGSGRHRGIHPRGQGKQEVARGSRRWPRQRRRAPRLASVRPPGRGGRGQGGGGGLGRLGRLVAPGRLRVSGPGRFSALFYFFFLLFCFI